MSEIAPDVAEYAWGHKYFHMLNPGKLDDFHSPTYQRFHLVKVLQVPPSQDGRYVVAGRFVAMARELGIPMNHLTTALNRRHGAPHRYWRIGTRLGGTDSVWDTMRQEGCVAIGGELLPDLSDVGYSKEGRERIRALLEKHYPNSPQVLGKKARQFLNFVYAISEGDSVLAADGNEVLAIGRVAGDYVYVRGSACPHRRPVEWLTTQTWQMPEREGLRTTLHELRKHAVNLVEIERRVQGRPILDIPPRGPVLRGVPARIAEVLTRKGQVILYGPPGTGKTYWAERAARELAARSAFGAGFADLDSGQVKEIARDGEGEAGLVRMCCFHPAYGYEDFIEGYRPETIDGQLNFVLRDGIFTRLCVDAERSPSKRFYLIIDEINRGDIPRIFGELMTVLEKSTRGKVVHLPISGRPFNVPDNVFVIGTMNTADRSIALLDTALRRRFGFIELMPDISVLGDSVLSGIPLGLWLASLNRRICEHVGRDARNLQIGHSYLMNGERPVAPFREFARAVRQDIIPLLEEYCYEDYSILGSILGNALVDTEKMTIQESLFDPSQREALVEALLAPCSELAASAQSVAADEAESEDTDSNGDDEEEPEGAQEGNA